MVPCEDCMLSFSRAGEGTVASHAALGMGIVSCFLSTLVLELWLPELSAVQPFPCSPFLLFFAPAGLSTHPEYILASGKQKRYVTFALPAIYGPFINHEVIGVLFHSWWASL